MQFKTITLATKDLDAIRSFYVDRLGFSVTAAQEGKICLGAGTTELVFQERDDSAAPFYHFAFDIPENQFIEAKKWLLAKGVSLMYFKGKDEFDFVNWNAHSLYFYDESENIVELIARHNLANASALPFSANSIIAVSEIGLPAVDLAEMSDILQEKLNLSLFKNSSANFQPLGTETGLFIGVTVGRKWFPECAKAAEFDTVVELEGGARVLEYGAYRVIY